jgi:polysaccharide biosynthesis protein VpsQ
MRSDLNDMRLKWLPFSLLLLAIVGITVGIDVGRLKSVTGWINSVPFGDKFGHLLIIGLLTFLLNHALAGRMVKIGRLKLLLGCTIVGVAMTVEECSQLWFPVRTFDLIDLSANYLGIALAGLIQRQRNVG